MPGCGHRSDRGAGRAQILKGHRRHRQQVASALVDDVCAQAARGVAELLTGAGYVVADIARALTDVFQPDGRRGGTSVLRTVGYAIARTSPGCSRRRNCAPATVAEGRLPDPAKSIGYTVTEIGAALQGVPRA